MKSFEKLIQAIIANDSLLCVGLDPRPDRFPPQVIAQPDPILAFNKTIIDATADLVCAYKPNIAFYEAQGLEGLAALRRTIEYIHKVTDVPVILDAKRGDIGSTAEAYAKAAFEVWGADAVTVNPYLGHDAVQPFTAYADRGVFLLCHTSNPGATDLQTLDCGGRPLYQVVAERAARWGANVGLVIGATYPQALRAVREMTPQMWVLLPGVGAQGGDLEAALAAGLDEQGSGIIVSASRSIIYAEDPRIAAQELRDRINAARSVPNSQFPIPKSQIATSPRNQLILALADIGCVRFGDFTLRSGQRSPLYIDLRLLVSHPSTLRDVARAYAHLLHPLTFDRLAAIPYAALPIGTAVSLESGCPLIYPRKEVKGYGTRRAVEGELQKGERVVVLDDLITTGASKLEAIAPLEELGLQVEDVVVLIDREQGGREYLEERGYRLHTVFGLGEMLDVLAQHGRISTARRDEVKAFLAGSQSP
ncbi:MAG TPA: orotidine-5'-phosphate decarboxylase [Anaerolineae bacterium]|nr:orotidine-5'-phosphate decarboxylase [Anaerolineae bacterium]